ncbi:MAG: O-antigen ligase family protein [Vicinamibacterales bacterium]|nr:O-antigen ligase family protein [Vicinamibacterales bacterium]
MCAVLLLGWGALAFGAEYSWAYAPLLVFSVVVAVLGLLASTRGRFPARALGFALAAIFVGGLLQLVPLSQRTIRTVSPASVVADYRQLYAKATMRSGDAAAASDLEARRPVSIAPSRTVLGLTFLAAFAILLVGCARGISAVGPHGIARGILVLGLLVALLELMQKASGSDVVYGFWYPPQLKGYQSAPFINRNHTAGWLVMALSLSAGYFAGGLANGLRGVKTGWRHRILWLSSRDASETLLTGFAIAVMAISIVATASRSGSICLALVIVMFGWWMVRRQPSGSRKMIAFAYLLVVLFAAVSLGGVEILAGRFYGASWSNVDGRLDLWQDTIRVVRDFPLTGTGLNTYGIAMLHYQTVQDGSQYIEAHNDYLHILAEGGLLLGLPILLALLLFIREVWRRFREGADDTATYWLRAGAVTGLGAITFQEFFDFTLQMPGAAALFVVLVAIAIHRPSHGARDSSVLVRGPLPPGSAPVGRS